MIAKRFYGWPLVGVGFLLYGLGIGPAYYSWGFFAPEVIADLGLTREQVGEIFGTFTLTFAVAGPAAAVAIRRFGLRAVFTVGALIAACGFWMVSRAQSVAALYLWYSLIGGFGIGLSTVLPAQTLPVFWFKKYRARATAIILLGAGVVGGLVTPIDDVILRHWDWRVGWMIIAATSLLVAVLAAVFVRNQPEDLGQRRDGLEPASSGEAEPTEEAAVESRPQFTVLQAVMTPQFLIATFAGLANTVPWRVLTAHGRLHFEDLGFTPTVAAAVLGVRVGVSSVGRLSGSLGDFLSPTRVLATALVINSLGLGGLLVADTAAMAYPSVVLLGFGYGVAYVSVPVVFGQFFGRTAFVGTAGLRIAVVGAVGWLGPKWAGAAADQTGSYASTIAVLMALCFVGAVVIFPCRPPRLAEVAATT